VPRRRRERLLRPARPNVGMQALYRRRLTDLIAAMHQSVVARVRAVYAANTPEIAKDAWRSGSGRRSRSAATPS
jgi:hypothetical protein